MGNPDFKVKPIGPIKCWSVGLDNFLVNLCLPKRISRKAKKDYWKGEHKNPPYLFNLSPTNLEWQGNLGVDDYRTKQTKKAEGISDPAFIILWFRILFFENEDNFQSHPIFNDLCVLH
jgi:hypothetical protein